MANRDSSPNDGSPSDDQAQLPDPGPHALQDTTAGAVQGRERIKSRDIASKPKKKREPIPRVLESHRTDRRCVPPEARSLLSIAKEGRLCLFSAYELMTMWAAATGTSIRSGDDRLKTVRCEDVYIANERHGSDRLTIHWNINAGIVSAVQQPVAWAMTAMTTLANMVLPERLQDAKNKMGEIQRMKCHGIIQPNDAQIDGLVDTRSDSPYNSKLAKLSQIAAAAKEAERQSIDVLGIARKRHGLDKTPFSIDRNDGKWVINDHHGTIDNRCIRSFLYDDSAVKAVESYLAREESSAKASRDLTQFRDRHSPWRITGLGPDEYERWPTPDEWGPSASREVAKALYRMTSIRRVELEELVPEFSDDMEGMIRWRFSATIDDTIRDIQRILLQTGVEMS